MLFEIAAGVACVLPAILVCDILWIAQRNAVMYINDIRGDDGELRIFNNCSGKLGELPWCVFVMSTIVFIVGCFISNDIASDFSKHYSGDALIAKHERFEYLGVWCQTVYLALNVLFISTLATLNHLRRIKRLENGTDQPIDETQRVASDIIHAVGGIDNISEVTADITRLKITTKTYNTDDCIMTDVLRMTDVIAGVVRVGTNNIDLIIGTTAKQYATEITKMMRG